MTAGDMVQIHMLTAYPASLLNRDDAGLAKRIPFGGAVRTRVSSQCLKKHWRDAPGVTELGDLADRSTRIYEQRVAEPLQEQHDATAEEARAVARYLMEKTVNTNVVDDNGRLRSGQLLVLTRAETDWLAELGAQVLEAAREAEVDFGGSQVENVLEDASPLDPKSLKKQLQELPASLDTALFGRMVTSDLFARVDASVGVAHAFTTHEEAAETDYFTAVDTLNVDDPGAGLIQDTELTTGVFYLYAVIDMEQLRDNLGGSDASAARLARNLVEAMATVSPGAKRGSTAPYSYAEFVLLERGDEQPRTLANAFLEPVREVGADTMQASVTALLAHRTSMEAMYGAFDGKEAVSSLHPLAEGRMEGVSFAEALDTIFASDE